MNRHLQCITCNPLLQPCIISINQFVDLLSSPLPTTCVAGVTTLGVYNTPYILWNWSRVLSHHRWSSEHLPFQEWTCLHSNDILSKFVVVPAREINFSSLNWSISWMNSQGQRDHSGTNPVHDLLWKYILLYVLPTISYDLWIIRFCRSRCYLSARTLKDNAKGKTKSKYYIKSQWITEFCPFYDFMQISHSTRVPPGAYSLIFCLLLVFCSYVSSVGLVLSVKDPLVIGFMSYFDRVF